MSWFACFLNNFPNHITLTGQETILFHSLYFFHCKFWARYDVSRVPVGNKHANTRVRKHVRTHTRFQGSVGMPSKSMPNVVTRCSFWNTVTNVEISFHGEWVQTFRKRPSTKYTRKSIFVDSSFGTRFLMVISCPAPTCHDYDVDPVWLAHQ